MNNFDGLPDFFVSESAEIPSEHLVPLDSDEKLASEQYMQRIGKNKSAICARIFYRRTNCGLGYSVAKAHVQNLNSNRAVSVTIKVVWRSQTHMACPCEVIHLVC